MVFRSPHLRQVLQDRQNLYNDSLANGIYTPFIYPWDILPVVYLAVGVIFTPSLSPQLGRICRYLLTLVAFVHLVVRWPYARTVGLTAGYGIGLAGFWGLVMTVMLLALHDPGKDFRRIEVRKVRQNPGGEAHTNGESSPSKIAAPLRNRFGTKEHYNAQISLVKDKDASHNDAIEFVWQGFPKELGHRMDWAIDLVTSFRGINWNFRVPIKTHVVPPPEGDPPKLSSEAEKLNEGASQRLQRSAVLKFIYYYVVLDLIKTVVMTDPYWLGVADLESRSPWPWLASLNHMLPGATHFVRLSVSLISVVAALTLIFSLSPLFFAAVLPYLLGEDKIYDITRSPILEVWMYPPQWGSMFNTLCNKGLAGMWSTWWHQMFRYGISEPSRILTKKLNVNPRGQLGRVVQLFVAFGITAGIHTAASSTTFSIVPSKPWHPFMFFMSQAIGILVQTWISQILNRAIHFPKVVRQAGNFGFCFVFMWYIGPLLANDFARCQIWLFEPVPVSIFRGLGFGPGDCWIPWLAWPEGGRWLGWWNGGRWYNSGLGIY